MSLPNRKRKDPLDLNTFQNKKHIVTQCLLFKIKKHIVTQCLLLKKYIPLIWYNLEIILQFII